MAVAERPQTALDERIVESSTLEAALEAREKKKASLGGVRKEYKELDDRAKALLAEHAIEDGEVVRIGRFRISKSAVPGRSVAFETDPSSRLRITALDEAA